jgi:hypothetical protein
MSMPLIKLITESLTAVNLVLRLENNYLNVDPSDNKYQVSQKEHVGKHKPKYNERKGIEMFVLS